MGIESTVYQQYQLVLVCETYHLNIDPTLTHGWVAPTAPPPLPFFLLVLLAGSGGEGRVRESNGEVGTVDDERK